MNRSSYQISQNSVHRTLGTEYKMMLVLINRIQGKCYACMWLTPFVSINNAAIQGVWSHGQQRQEPVVTACCEAAPETVHSIFLNCRKCL